MVTGPMVEAACSQALHGSTSSATRAMLVSTAVTNYVAQYAAGAPIDDAGPFTEFAPTRIPQATLGAGADPILITLTYIPVDGTEEQTQSVTGAAGATVQFPFPVQRITRVQTDADPVDVLDIEAGDTMTSPAARYVFANAAGDVACRLVEDSADVTVAMAVSTSLAIRPSIIRSTGTTATVVLLW